MHGLASLPQHGSSSLLDSSTTNSPPSTDPSSSTTELDPLQVLRGQPDVFGFQHTYKMPSAASLAELKAHLCLREHLNHEECERALLPTLEHASMVHSHIHHPTAEGSDETFIQTRNAIVYISLVVVVYVIVVLWLVSANFRSTVSSAAGSGNSVARNVMGHVTGNSGLATDDDSELESLIVVRDKGGKRGPKCTTVLDQEDDGDYV